jgi:TonB family protein
MPKRVLLIEYEPRYVERIRTLLTPLGHAVTEAHDGEAGLQSFGNSRFDLILLSGMLPRLPSAEVIREIRKKGGATAPPIILMMTGYRGSNRKADAQKVGAFDILMRPFSDEDFMGVVREAIDATDVGAKTMRIETSAIAAGSPLTSSDIFSDVLDELTADPSKKRPTPPPMPAAPEPFAAAAAPPSAPKPSAESDMDKRLRDTLSGFLSSRPAAATRAAAPSEKPPSERTPPPVVAPPPPPPPAPKPRLSSDTDVDRILEDTLSGFVLPKPKTSSGLTPPAMPASTAVAPPKRREEPAAAVPSSGPDHFGQYEILERIASGGMAELYKAKRTGVEGFQKIVAIKKILPHLADDEAFVTMFADEAKLAAQLNHPNIIHIYDLGKIQAGGYFIAMEYVDGRDLRAIQQAGRNLGVPLPVPLAVYVASKVASALDYAHRRRDADGHELNIVHRDVSPQNILISYEGDIKLCDFGIAKAASKASKTQSGALKGKIQYMSPEQAWGKPIDRRSDLFSLGVVLHELLTGERLFGGETDINVLEKVRIAEVAAPSASNPEVPQNLDAVVLKALAKEPDDRYANASDLLRDLDSVLYSYTPAPGSADVAIYLHRLQAEEGAVAEAKAREAAQAVEESEPAARKRKSKGAPVARKSSPVIPPASPAPPPVVPPPPPPAAVAPPPREPARTPEVFGSLERSAEAEKASRMPLILLVAAAAAALVGFFVWRTMKPSGARPVVLAPTAAAAVPTAAPTVAVAAAAVPTAAPAMDPKAVEAEVQRQLAAKRRELDKAAAATAAKAPTTGPALEAAPPPVPVPVEPTLPPPTIPPTAVPIPTTVPTEPPAVEAPRSPETQRGDLVGPGAGVVEPTLVAPPRVVYPAIARQQRIEGKVVVLVLIDENGRVAESRLQQGVSQAAINDAVLSAVKNAKFRAATKNGIPVKMWRPIIVEVKP